MKALGLILGALLATLALSSCSKSDKSKTQEQLIEENAKKILPKYLALERREQQVDATVWAKELTAQRCGEVFLILWDKLNLTTNKWDMVSEFAVALFTLPSFQSPMQLPQSGQMWKSGGAGSKLTRGEWQQWLEAKRSAGWQISKAEFRHTRFNPASPPSSEFYVCFEVANPATLETAAIEGTLHVDWEPLPASYEAPSVREIDASQLTVRSRRGPTPFTLAFDEAIPERDKWPFVDPLIVYDLDGDGRSEIILVAKNLVYRFADGKFKSEPLCTTDPGRTHTALIADFTQDGHADMLCVKSEGLFLYEGSAEGKFDREPRPVWSDQSKIRYALAMTCGDIDADGDLDVFLTQYKVPYLLGQIPTPYYDANDGHPSFLLRNDGQGNFTDVTAEVGLEPKRHRRTYSASFVDLDDDHNLDLAVISDFAGLDLYRNDGKGHFTDVTREWAGEPYAAGMAHALADFNRDGKTDLLMMGMTSPTVDRLESMNLKRNDSRIDESKRAKVLSGNRLLVGKAKGGFAGGTLSDSIQRSGWSWGCSAFDFDNDGFLDVYVANGHETKQNTRDYEPQYWLHDLYVGSSSEDNVNLTYFAARSGATRGHGDSYGGWERNRFYWNDHGEKFVEMAPLFGVSLQQDCRNVVADDLDGDGRVDLLVTTFEVWPEKKQTLKIFRNALPNAGNWVGVRLREQGGGFSPVGAVITLQSNLGVTTRQLVTGDSYRSQHPNIVHFGLGQNPKVDRIEIRWPNGKQTEIREPANNRYLDVTPPKL
ncbi:MAG TPA: CRTAC1 family protein [Verrucomicrobiae bacterium]|nr:CRTAC1 family protein [Verrucomicrobiae bacterium]